MQIRSRLYDGWFYNGALIRFVDEMPEDEALASCATAILTPNTISRTSGATIPMSNTFFERFRQDMIAKNSGPSPYDSAISGFVIRKRPLRQRVRNAYAAYRKAGIPVHLSALAAIYIATGWKWIWPGPDNRRPQKEV